MRRSISPWILAAFTLSGATAANAAPIAIGGVDARSEYTYAAGPQLGIYTFADTATSEPGTVTTSDLSGFVGGRITLELMLDTTGFVPATGNVLDGKFVGTGPGSEVVIWDATQTTVLLSFDVSFLEVTQRAFSNGSRISIGDNVASSVGVTSLLTVTGGTRAGDVGGIGTPAALRLQLNRPNPALTTTNQNGYWSTPTVTVGNGYTPLSASNWDLLIVPEPGTLLLVGAGLGGFAALRRRTPR